MKNIKNYKKATNKLQKGFRKLYKAITMYKTSMKNEKLQNVVIFCGHSVRLEEVAIFLNDCTEILLGC